PAPSSAIAPARSSSRRAPARRAATPTRRRARRAAARRTARAPARRRRRNSRGAGPAGRKGRELAMRNKGSKTASNRTKELAVTADTAFEEQIRSTFATAAQIELAVLQGALATNEGKINDDDVTVIVIDLDTRQPEDMAALTRLMGRTNGWPPVVVVTPSFDKDMARQMLQMRVADFLVKPVQPVELVRTCARVVQTPNAPEQTEAEIFTYLSAVGGAGVTTLSIQTALLLLYNNGSKTR